MSTPCLYELPVEILHRIIDYIDPETIFFSFRNVCKYFYTVINSYNQYKLDFRSITKSAFNHIHQLIQPDHIISLIISNEYKTPGQIDLFISLFDIHQFTRLRSITLIHIPGSTLAIYVKHLSTCPLISLSIDCGPYHSSIITSEISQLFMKTSIRHLKFNHIVPATDFYNIFFDTSHLETLTLDGNVNNATLNLPIENKSKLNSLTLNFYNSSVDKVLLILSCTQSLTHLKLTGQITTCEYVWDGYWWIEFIQNNLPKLQLFEFFFDKRIDHKESTYPIESIISSFQTSFWLDKKWYVICDYYQNECELQLYTIPICKSTFLYRPTSNKISYSNSTNNTSYIMDNICSLVMNSIPTIDLIHDLNLLPSRPLFSRVIKLTLLITNQFSNDSIDHLSNFIDFLHLDTLSLTLDLSIESFKDLNTIINNLLDRTCNIQTVDIRCTRWNNLVKYFEIIFPMMCNQVKHLIIEISNKMDIEWIVKRCEQFSTISLVSNASYLSNHEQILNELEKQGREFTTLKNVVNTHIWFGKLKQNN